MNALYTHRMAHHQIQILCGCVVSPFNWDTLIKQSDNQIVYKITKYTLYKSKANSL